MYIISGMGGIGRTVRTESPEVMSDLNLVNIDGTLRVLARYEAQNRPIFYISFDIFVNTLSFKNLNVHFLPKSP